MKNKESGVMRNYRRARFFYLHNITFISKLIYKYMRVVYSCDIPYTCEIGKDVIFAHNGLGVVIHDNAKIGDRCKIYQNTTIGGRNGRGSPVIGDDVFVGANSLILGNCHIGNNAVIGAGSIVIEDVPENALIVGEKSKVKKIYENKNEQD